MTFTSIWLLVTANLAAETSSSVKFVFRPAAGSIAKSTVAKTKLCSQLAAILVAYRFNCGENYTTSSLFQIR